MGLSGLCLIHCLASAIFFGLVASAGGLLGSPLVHEAGLALALLLGTIASVRGWRNHGSPVPIAIGATGLICMGLALTMQHGRNEVALTIFGVLVLALGHQLNRAPNG